MLHTHTAAMQNKMQLQTTPVCLRTAGLHTTLPLFMLKTHQVNTIVLFMQNISPFLDWAHKDRSPVPGQVTYNHDLVLVKHWIYHASLILLELGMGSHKTETSKDPRHPVFSACSSFPRLQPKVVSVHLTLYSDQTRFLFTVCNVGRDSLTPWHMPSQGLRYETLGEMC